MEQNKNISETNLLFPIFLKLENLRVLVIGGGNVALEKINALLQNNPAANIKVIAIAINDSIKELSNQHENIKLTIKKYEIADLENFDIVIAAVNDYETSERIYNDAREKRVLINVADKPALCDFYLGSIVKKGNLKMAISTNGKSPTIARKLKEAFSEMIPDELNEVLDSMNIIRHRLKGNFTEKVKKLNEITRVLVSNEKEEEVPGKE